MSTMARLRSFSLLILLALAACGGGGASSAEAREPAPTTSTAAAAPMQAQCEAFFARARECSDAYLATLVDLRIELDNPAGIAEQARTEGRDPLVAKAHEEWAVDSQPENVTRTCAEGAARMPPEQVEAMTAQSERCLAETDCDAFAACAKELQRPMLTPH